LEHGPSWSDKNHAIFKRAIAAAARFPPARRSERKARQEATPPPPKAADYARDKGRALLHNCLNAEAVAPTDGLNARH
jgi:hypothetical protein